MTGKGISTIMLGHGLSESRVEMSASGYFNPSNVKYGVWLRVQYFDFLVWLCWHRRKVETLWGFLSLPSGSSRSLWDLSLWLVVFNPAQFDAMEGSARRGQFEEALEEDESVSLKRLQISVGALNSMSFLCG
jgi:hypothetical protein